MMYDVVVVFLQMQIHVGHVPFLAGLHSEILPWRLAAHEPPSPTPVHRCDERSTGRLMLAVAGGPVLSVRIDARPQLQLVSLGVAHRLAHDHDDDDEDGQQHENAADRHRDHGTVTHCACGWFWVVWGWFARE